MTVQFIDARKKIQTDEVPTGEQVEALRKKLNWSQEALANHMTKAGLPISQSEISLIERGSESQPTKAGYKNTHDPTKPKFLGNGYHGYRERLRLFFLRHGVVFVDDCTVLISSIDTIYAPFISALSMLDFGSKPESEIEVSTRRKEFESLAGVALADAARWTLSKSYVEEREAYANGKNRLDWDFEDLNNE